MFLELGEIPYKDLHNLRTMSLSGILPGNPFGTSINTSTFRSACPKAFV
jgi:hypothetical protein